MNAVDHIVEQLANHGLDTFFVFTGGAIVPFIDAVGRNTKCRYFCFQHEQAAAMAAEAYWKTSGKIATVLVTSGPGVQNILNGVCGCWYDSVPCLFISGQVNTNESLDSIVSKPRQLGFQETPVVETFKQCTLMCEKIKNSDELSDVFSRAASLLLTSSRPGPVLIDFPVNLQMSKHEVHINVQDLSHKYDTTCLVDDMKLFNKPLVILGNGARGSDVQGWIEKAQIPFVCSWAASDIIPHDHPLFIGQHGVYGDRVANYAIQNANLLVILGARMDTRQIGGNLRTCSRNSKRIMVDVDIHEMNKLTERGFPVDWPIVSTVSRFVDNNPLDVLDTHEWIEILNTWKKEFGVESTREGDVYPLLEKLWSTLPEKCIVIPDTGGNLTWTMQTIHPKKGQRVFSNFGNSSMGYALPTAIGAAIGSDGKIPVYAIHGDGGFQLNIQELLTISKYKLPIKNYVINNAGYGIIKQFQDSYFNSRYTATDIHDVFGDVHVDYNKISEAYGGVEIHEIRIHPDQKIFPKLEFGNALENMSPQRPELHKYMLIPPVQPNVGSGWISK